MAATTTSTSVTGAIAQTKVPWWIILIQGIALLILGIMFLTAPAATLVTLIFFLGVYWLIGGIMDIVSIFINKTAWGWKLFSGIIGIIAGVLIMQHPLWASVLVPATLVWLLGLMGIVIGVVGIVRAFQGDGWGAGILGIFRGQAPVDYAVQHRDMPPNGARLAFLCRLDTHRISPGSIPRCPQPRADQQLVIPRIGQPYRS